LTSVKPRFGVATLLGKARRQAPADGRLAAAIATISDNCFPIRDRVERNIKLIRRIGLVLPRQCKN
jgi:hypothetical protein